MKVAALHQSLSDRARFGRIHVVDGFVDGSEPSTKDAVAALAAIAQGDTQLVVLDRTDNVNRLSLRNIPSVHVLPVDQLNPYDVLVADEVVFTRAAYELFVGHQVGKKVVDRSSVAPEVTAAAMLESRNGTDTHPGQNLQAAHEAAKSMDQVKSFRGSDPNIDGWSVSSESVEYVAIERHPDHVLATWPSTLGPAEAIQFFRSTFPQAVYADSADAYVEFTDGPPDWEQISALQGIHFIRVDSGSEVLIWEEPEDAGHLEDNRFFVIDPQVSARRLVGLIDATTERDVVELLSRFVDVGTLDLEPLGETG